MKFSIVIALLSLAPSSAAHAQSGGTYNLTWSVIAGGGGTSVGGTYSLSGTIGQADVQTGLSGGQYALAGGFWPGSRCPADFNGDGQLAVQDIFDFLSAWFAAAPSADFNGINGITVQDIFDFLAAWFAGCP